MEWVEVTGRTVEEAKDAALDQLGVDEAEAEFEVLEEPKPGLFGRLRSQARVRARVMPSAPRPKLDRRERRRGRSGSGAGGGSGGGGRSGSGSESGTSGAGGAAAASSQAGGGGGGGRSGGRSRNPGRGSGGPSGGGRRQGELMQEPGNGREDDDREQGEGEDDEVEVAEEFLAGLLETFGTSFTIEERPLEDDLVELSVAGDDLGVLIGPRGQTLAAVQELARTVVQRRSRGRASRIVIDVAGYRQARRTALERFTRQVADQVLSSGVPRVLEPMPPADRKVVHDVVNTIDGVTTSSEGEEPRRRVVISPQGGTA